MWKSFAVKHSKWDLVILTSDTSVKAHTAWLCEFYAVVLLFVKFVIWIWSAMIASLIIYIVFVRHAFVLVALLVKLGLRSRRRTVCSTLARLEWRLLQIATLHSRQGSHCPPPPAIRTKRGEELRT